MAKVKVRLVAVSPKLLLEWWKQLFNRKPASKEDAKHQHTVLARIEAVEGFLFDEKEEQIRIEVAYCSKCEKDIFFKELDEEDRKFAKDNGQCPICKQLSERETKDKDQAEAKATHFEPTKELFLKIERHLRSWLWDVLKKPIKDICTPQQRHELRLVAETLGFKKDWKTWAAKYAETDPLPEDDEIEWEEGEEDDEEEPGEEGKDTEDSDGTEGGDEGEGDKPEPEPECKPEPESKPVEDKEAGGEAEQAAPAPESETPSE